MSGKHLDDELDKKCTECLVNFTGRSNASLSAFEKSASEVFRSFEEKTADLFTSILVDHARMRDSVTLFMDTTKTNMDAKAATLESSVSRSSDVRTKAAQGIAAITLGVVLFFCGYFLSKLDNMTEDYSKLKQEKADRKEVLLTKEADALFKIQDTHYRKIFTLQPGAAYVDTTNLDWLKKGILGGALRGGTTELHD